MPKLATHTTRPGSLSALALTEIKKQKDSGECMRYGPEHRHTHVDIYHKLPMDILVLQNLTLCQSLC